MSTNKTARKHKSAILAKIMDETSPVEKQQIENKMTLAARIADLINAKGLGKSELAVQMGKNPSEITKWLSGTQNLTIDTLTEIAFALNITIAELFAPKQVQIVHRFHLVVSSKSEKSFPVSTPYADSKVGSKRVWGYPCLS